MVFVNNVFSVARGKKYNADEQMAQLYMPCPASVYQWQNKEHHMLAPLIMVHKIKSECAEYYIKLLKWS